ncbi:hypothetical protein [Pseudomonas brassicacearum]|uniref:Uncharacterized protein n=1 Tax=Pseudomonas brassicacearum TaxID=930166 RepID=A0AAJ3FTF1_9PSED|nr:hypothetical protein [Pseudomonas brassicacearum]NUT80289.1 hypothetical protein [Pseudomonas brassicacearum]
MSPSRQARILRGRSKPADNKKPSNPDRPANLSGRWRTKNAPLKNPLPLFKKQLDEPFLALAQLLLSALATSEKLTKRMFLSEEKGAKPER